MSVPYPPLAHVESGSENEDGSKKKSGEDLDKEVDELGELLEDFGKKSDTGDPKSGEEGSKDEIPAKHKKATQYTSEQRKAATRVQHCAEKDYYGILDLAEKCSKIEIVKAYRKLSLLTHPDQNKYKDAENAFKS